MKISGDNEDMEEFINKRIAELRKKLGLSKAKFAERIGITGQFVSMVESGKSKFTEANIRLICFTFKVNEEWLREGKGEMMDDGAQLLEWEERLLAIFRRLSPEGQKLLLKLSDSLLESVEHKAEQEQAWNEGLGNQAQNKPPEAEVSQNALGGATRPLEAPKSDKGEDRA
jgi:transcriptional regulator with XRE-family HTH domain